MKHLIGPVNFSVSARVAMQLGRESISSSITAILELVKNSYDADADRVRIRFITVRSHRMLIVEDNGDGMTAEALRAKWMLIGTSNKVRDRRSSGKNRVKTGEKGLGRLGLDRLCTFTRVQSVTQGSEDAVELKIDWSKYEREDARLESVQHNIYSIPSLKRDAIEPEDELGEYPHGTRLILMGLKDRWDEGQIKKLHEELSFLVSPFGRPEDFAIHLQTDGVAPYLDGEIEPPDEILEQAYWTVSSNIDDQGNVGIDMVSPGRHASYQLPLTPWNRFVIGLGDAPLCGPLSFKLYFFRRDEAEGEDQLSRPALINFLQNNQGVRIYRDGFRVKPYGEPNGEGDWLRLAYRRMQHPGGVRQTKGWRVGYNQVVGAVFLTRDENPALVDQTNREGLVLGDAYQHLVAFAQRTVRFFESHHHEYETNNERYFQQKLISRDETENAFHTMSQALRELQRIKTTIRSQEESRFFEGADKLQSSVEVENVSNALSNVVATFEQTFRQQDDRIEQQEKEKNTMANLASLGILTACFGHDTLGWTNNVVGRANLVSGKIETGKFMVAPDVEKDVKSDLDVLISNANKIHTFADFAMGNVSPTKRRRSTFCVKELASEVFGMFSMTFQNQKHVDVDIDDVPSESCYIFGYKIDWESIFSNLIVNSVWAMEGMPINSGSRKIRLQIHPSDEGYKVIFHDSGRGLEAGTEEQIFDPGFSTKRNHLGEQEGTGMGLMIVRSFVTQNSGGRIRALANGELGGATFIIDVPRAAQKRNTKRENQNAA